jgi:cytochrome oxidase Cu insertion factor (SCO1/SenC/PrrC family)
MRMLMTLMAGLSMAGAAMAQTPTPVPPAGQAPAAPPAPVFTVKAGDVAPAFSLQGSDGKTYTLADFAGKKAVVLAWFPKAFTGG